MKQRGRKSTAQLSIVASTVDERPPAPDDLTPDERELWQQITARREPAYFDEAAIPLLKEFCRLTTQVDELAETIEGFDHQYLLVPDAAKAYKTVCDIRDKAQGRLIALARSMRLTAQSRYIPHAAGARPKGKAATRQPWAKD